MARPGPQTRPLHRLHRRDRRRGLQALLTQQHRREVRLGESSSRPARAWAGFGEAKNH